MSFPLILSFALSLGQTVSEGPWLPEAEQQKIRRMWPDGVPSSPRMKFYKLDPVYQNMYTMNNGRSRFTEITSVTDVDPWRVSGGMHHVSASEWRNVTGLALSGKITYWKEDTDVRAFSLVPKHRWRFPEGTLAYDVLIRTKNGKEHIFEIRVHEKRKYDWDDGTTYRPDVAPVEGSREELTWRFSNENLSASAVTYSVKVAKMPRFNATRKVFVDGGEFWPKQYAGAGMACNNCHGRVGQLYDVPGRIYREARRGDDGRFSWHPFTGGEVDWRWPMEQGGPPPVAPAPPGETRYAEPEFYNQGSSFQPSFNRFRRR